MDSIFFASEYTNPPFSQLVQHPNCVRFFAYILPTRLPLTECIRCSAYIRPGYLRAYFRPIQGH